jgi:nicotinamide riboside kinase
MAIGTLVIGDSGTGKSTSVETLNPEDTFIINVQGKPLPFKNKYTKTTTPKEGNLYVTDDAKIIKSLLQFISANRPEIKHVVIDDNQYASANEFMRRAEEKGFDKFTSIAKNIWSTAEVLKELRDDLIVFILHHSEEATDSAGSRYKKAKTIGKLVDDKITLEGMYTIVLYTDVQKNDDKQIEYKFVTQNTGNTTAKSPKGMFDELYIPNDLKLVSDKINEYYN